MKKYEVRMTWNSALVCEYETLDEALGYSLGTAHGVVCTPNGEIVARRTGLELGDGGWRFGWTGENIPFVADDYLLPAGYDEGDPVL